jgi:hypothetical protein
MHEPLSQDDQWYVLIGEQQYGPVRYEHLAQFAGQGRLQKTNWLWKDGLASWIAAGDMPGLFADAISRRDPSAQLNEYASHNNKQKRNLKVRAKEEIKNFLWMFFYLWLVFGMLAIHESIILSQHQIPYVSHGLAVVNALIFAKVMLVAEGLHLGHRFDEKPLIYPIICKSILFGIALICFHILEHIVIGMWHGEQMAQSLEKVGADNLKGMVSIGIITTVALVPFFILSEISRVMGKDEFWSLLFKRSRARPNIHAEGHGP